MTGEIQTKAGLLSQPGDALRKARMLRGLSLADIAADLHMTETVLDELEKMQLAAKPAAIIRMQVRSYARYLGLDADLITASYTGHYKQPPLHKGVRAENGSDKSARPYMPLLLGVSAVFPLILVAGWSIWQVGPDKDEVLSDPLSVSSRIRPGQSSSAAHAQLLQQPIARQLAVRARERAWLEVRGSDGTVFRSRYMAPGEIYYPRLKAGWTLTARNAGAFAVLLDKETVFDLGEEGQAVYSRNIDALMQDAEETLRQARMLQAARDSDSR